ncbi:MAG: DUF5004 domain-containing protein [Flavobacteriales bacterium]|nr:DUF5004 domain-containing protein [Flavobacteriales bacterium]
MNKIETKNQNWSVNMKNFTRFFTLVFALTILFAGCKEEIEGELGEPFDKVAGLNGKWELTSFIQKDLNNPIKEERDLSQFYIIDGVTPLQLTFNSSDLSYTVAITEGRNYFGEGGNWRLDDPEYPTQVIMESATDTAAFDLGTIVRTFDSTMELELLRGCDVGGDNETQTVIYRFVFNRVNE